MQYGEGRLLIVTDHIDVDHRQNILYVIRIFVEMILNPKMFGAPHEAYRASRSWQGAYFNEVSQQPGDF